MKNSIKANLKYIIMSVVLIILVIGLIIIAVHYFGNNSADNEEDTYFSSTSDASDTDDSLSGDSNFLVLITDETKRQVIYLCIFDFNIYSGNTVVTPLDLSTIYEGNTYSYYFEYGGISLLIDAVSNMRSCVIERYILVDKDGFYDLFDNIGAVHMYIDESFTYEASDMVQNVEAGENDLDSAMLYTYICSVAEKQDGINIITELVCDIANDYISSIEADDADELFSELINCVDTDFSISDYYDKSADIQYIIENNVEFTAYSDVGQ
ncbi:MAG: LCP family protein [Clostridiales bacterium]|nr:LCP family protein [Clostridiales bacterium]